MVNANVGSNVYTGTVIANFFVDNNAPAYN